MDGSAPNASNALRCHEGFDWLLADMKPLGIWTSDTIQTGIADKTHFWRSLNGAGAARQAPHFQETGAQLE